MGCHNGVREELKGRRKAEDVRDRDIGCVIALKVPLMDPRAILAQQKHNRRTGRRLGIFLPLLDFRQFYGRMGSLLRLWTTDAFAMMIFWGRVLFPRNSPPPAPPNPRTVPACGGAPCGAGRAGNARGKLRANKINSVSVVPFLNRPLNAALSSTTSPLDLRPTSLLLRQDTVLAHLPWALRGDCDYLLLLLWLQEKNKKQNKKKKGKGERKKN